MRIIRLFIGLIVAAIFFLIIRLPLGIVWFWCYSLASMGEIIDDLFTDHLNPIGKKIYDWSRGKK